MQPSSDLSWIALNVRNHPMILILTVLSEGQCCICLLWVSVPQSFNGKMKGIKMTNCPMSLEIFSPGSKCGLFKILPITIMYSCYGNLQWPHVPFVHVTFPFTEACRESLWTQAPITQPLPLHSPLKWLIQSFKPASSLRLHPPRISALMTRRFISIISILGATFLIFIYYSLYACGKLFRSH